jgi:hypothetical protein
MGIQSCLQSWYFAIGWQVSSIALMNQLSTAKLQLSFVPWVDSNATVMFANEDSFVIPYGKQSCILVIVSNSSHFSWNMLHYFQ